VCVCVRVSVCVGVWSRQDDEVRCRYLLCPASTDVSLLKKFVFLKFDLSDQQHSVSVNTACRSISYT